MSAGEPKPPPNFIIRLDGAGIKPWLVPTRTLSRILSAVQRLVEQRDDLVDVEEPSTFEADTETRTLQLILIKNCSAGYALSSRNSEGTIAIIRETGRAVADPDHAHWHPSTISSLDELSQIARQLGCVVEFREMRGGRGLGPVLAVIRSDTFSEVQRRAFVRGHTSVYGRLERVGGASAMKCGIHVHGRSKMLFCEVASSDLVRELGKHIYTDVVLSGQATWYTFNKQLKSLKVTSFSPAKTAPLAEVAKRIREAGGSAWDEVADPDAYIREMRG